MRKVIGILGLAFIALLVFTLVPTSEAFAEGACFGGIENADGACCYLQEVVEGPYGPRGRYSCISEDGTTSTGWGPPAIPQIQ